MLKDLRRCFSFSANLKSLYSRHSERDAALDGLRAISILMLVLFHAANITALNFEGGPQAYIESLPRSVLWLMQADKGVDIFFVLSGFLIGRLLMQEYARDGHLRVGRFYLRRFLRLFPAYAVLLLLVLVTPINHNKWYLLANLAYVNNYLSLENMLAPWTWSLAVEEQFYLLLPPFLVLLYFHSRYQLGWLFVLIAAAPVIRYIILLNQPDVLVSPYIALATDENFLESFYDNLHTRYDALLIGVLAAHLHLNNWRLTQMLSRHAYAASLLVVASIAMVLLMLSLPLEHMHTQWTQSQIMFFHVLHRPLFAGAIATLMLATLHGNGLAVASRKLLASRVLLPFGQLAYSIYLFHIPFVILVHLFIKTHINHGSSQFESSHLLLLAGLSLIPSALFSSCVYLAIEKPVMNLRDLLFPANAGKNIRQTALAG